MGLNKALKMFNIKIIAIVRKEQQIAIADNVATKISNEFNYIDYEYIYRKLMLAKMYIAEIPKAISKAIYSYEDDTLYISDKEDLNDISEELLYECIHTLQDIRDNKGKVKQLGQCIFSEFKVYAMALNEASVQYIVSKVFKRETKEEVTAYGIKVKTYSPNKYPLICNIILQLLFIANETELVTSTIYSKDSFIIECIENLGGELSFTNMQKNLDDMLYTSEEIVGIKRKLKEEYKEELINEIYEKEELIRRLYMDNQMYIFTTYFDRLYNNLENLKDIKYYKKKLKDYREIMGTFVNESNEYFTQYYENYCKQKMTQLKVKEEEIERKNALALTVVSDNKIIQMFQKIKNMFSRIIGKV